MRWKSSSGCDDPGEERCCSSPSDGGGPGRAHGMIPTGAKGLWPAMIFFTWAGFDEMDEVTGKAPPNCSTMAQSRSPLNTTTVTKPSSKNL